MGGGLAIGYVTAPAAWLFMPYAAWVAFAFILNAAIFALN
jgi:tryptophan-rich sensory protein